MKKLLVYIIVGILVLSSLVFVGCKNKQPDEPKYITISFDTNGKDCTCPDDLTVEVGSTNFDLEIPTDAFVLPGYDLAWFTDKECTNVFNANSKPTENLTLYLGSQPKTYSISYTNKDEFDFVGEFKYSYVFGEGVKLPNVDLGKGYQKSGKWYYRDNAYFTDAVSKSIMEDLVLTFKADPINYDITYISNLPEGQTMNNPNILTYDVTMGTITLLPATAEGKTFSHWEYRSTVSKSRKIETIDIDLLLESLSFSICAVWEE